jgi:uncharacterized protein (DUF305 family)
MNKLAKQVIRQLERQVKSIKEWRKKTYHRPISWLR